MSQLSAFQIALRGFAMGCCDVVPGVSGGTAAFVLGIYDDLLSSLRNLNFRFLMPLAAGALFAIVALIRVVHHAINDQHLFPFVYAAFLGLILGSSLACFRAISRWRWQEAVLLVSAATAAAAITYWTASAAPVHEEGLFQPFTFCAGIAASVAMLLPGISGSFVLQVLGLYAPVVACVSALAGGQFMLGNILPVANLGLGFAIGIFSFASLVSFLLSRFRTVTLAALTGFMLGSVRTLWPFWSFHIEGGKLQRIECLAVDWSQPASYAALALAAATFYLVIWLEGLKDQKAKTLA